MGKMALSGGGHLCVCVECGERTSDRLYEGYGVSRGQAMGRGGGRSGANIRLTRCRVCDSILDRYLEYDPVLVVIDLILHKSEVYRHLLFNSKSFSPWARKRSLRCNLLVFFLLMVLVDAHTKWRIDAELQQTTTATVQLHGEAGEKNLRQACPSSFSSAASAQYDVVLSPSGRLHYRNAPTALPTLGFVGGGDDSYRNVVVNAEVT